MCHGFEERIGRLASLDLGPWALGSATLQGLDGTLAPARAASGMENYEKLQTYAVDEDVAEIEADARALIRQQSRRRVYPSAQEALEEGTDLSEAEGEYDWLRLYFEEVIWPEAERVSERVRHLHRSGEADVYYVQGDQPPADVERATQDMIERALFP